MALSNSVNPGGGLTLAQARALGVRTSGAVLTGARGLRRFRAKLGNALYAPVHIACWGDSITEGVGTENSNSIANNVIADSDGYPGQTRVMLAARYGASVGGSITPYFSGADARVTRSGTPTQDLTCGPMTWGGRIKSADYFEFTTPACTTVDILFYAGGTSDGSLIGGFSYQVDGGTVTNGLASGANGAPGYRVLTIPNLSNQAHVVRLVGLHATNVQHICGIRYHNNKGVVVSRFAKAGFSVPDMLGVGGSARNNAAISNAYNRARIAAAIGGFGEHLVIIAMGQNDGTLQNVAMGGGTGGEAIGAIYSTPSYYEDALRQRCAAIAAAGSCTLLLNTALPPPGGVTVPNGGQPYYTYHQAARRIAADTDHVAHLSIADRWGMTGDTTAAENVALGMLSDVASVHPSRQGYGDIANALVETLLRPDLA